MDRGRDRYGLDRAYATKRTRHRELSQLPNEASERVARFASRRGDLSRSILSGGRTTRRVVGLAPESAAWGTLGVGPRARKRFASTPLGPNLVGQFDTPALHPSLSASNLCGSGGNTVKLRCAAVQVRRSGSDTDSRVGRVAISRGCDRGRGCRGGPWVTRSGPNLTLIRPKCHTLAS